MADAAKDTDQSMEEILQSIKRIIAEEGDPVAQDNADVLELTDMLADDGAIVTPEKSTHTPIESISIEEIMAAPMASLTPPIEMAEIVAIPEPEPAPEPVALPEETVSFAVSEDVMEAPIPQPEPEPVAPAAPVVEESLLSETTLAAAAAALHALDDANKPAVVPLPHYVGFRSGTTVEDLMMESLKPLIKDWLDTNLPSIVERLVEKEIRKLANR